MINFLAINEENTNSSQNISASPKNKNATEAQEAKLFQIYDKAIKYQYDSKYDEARAHYQQVLDHELLAQKMNVQSSLSKLKYLTLKNLADVEYNCAHYNAALEHIARAVEVDDSDSQMWYKLGLWALETYQRDIDQSRDNLLLLARYSFETGVRINQEERGVSHDMPAFKYDDLLYLEQLIVVLYLIGDWLACQDVIHAVLKIDARHVLALKFQALLSGKSSEMRDVEDDTYQMEDDDVIYADHVINELQHLRTKRVKTGLTTERWSHNDTRAVDESETSLTRAVKAVTWFDLASLIHVTYTDRLRNRQRTDRSLFNLPLKIDLPEPAPVVNTENSSAPNMVVAEASNQSPNVRASEEIMLIDSTPLEPNIEQDSMLTTTDTNQEPLSEVTQDVTRDSTVFLTPRHKTPASIRRSRRIDEKKKSRPEMYQHVIESLQLIGAMKVREEVSEVEQSRDESNQPTNPDESSNITATSNVFVTPVKRKPAERVIVAVSDQEREHVEQFINQGNDAQYSLLFWMWRTVATLVECWTKKEMDYRPQYNERMANLFLTTTEIVERHFSTQYEPAVMTGVSFVSAEMTLDLALRATNDTDRAKHMTRCDTWLRRLENSAEYHAFMNSELAVRHVWMKLRMSELKRNFTAAVDELNECLTLLKANESKAVTLPLSNEPREITCTAVEQRLHELEGEKNQQVVRQVFEQGDHVTSVTQLTALLAHETELFAHWKEHLSTLKYDQAKARYDLLMMLYKSHLALNHHEDSVRTLLQVLECHRCVCKLSLHDDSKRRVRGRSAKTSEDKDQWLTRLELLAQLVEALNRESVSDALLSEIKQLMAVLLKPVLKNAAPLDDRELDHLESCAAVVLASLIAHCTLKQSESTSNMTALFKFLQLVHGWLGTHTACQQKNALLPRLMLHLFDTSVLDTEETELKTERDQCVCCVHKLSLPVLVDDQLHKRRELDPHTLNYTEPWSKHQISALYQLLTLPLEVDAEHEARQLYLFLNPIAYQILNARGKVQSRVATSVFAAIERCLPHITAQLTAPISKDYVKKYLAGHVTEAEVLRDQHAVECPGLYNDIYYLLGKAELARDGRYQMSGTARKHYKEQVARYLYFWPAWLELAEIYWLKMHDHMLHHLHGVTHKNADRAQIASVIELLPGEHVLMRRTANTPRHHVLYFMNALRKCLLCLHMVSELLQLQPLMDTAMKFLSPALLTVPQFTELFRGDNALTDELFEEEEKEPNSDTEVKATDHDLTRVTLLSQLRSVVKRMRYVDTRMENTPVQFSAAYSLTLIEQHIALLGPALYSAHRYIDHLQRSTTTDYFKFLSNLTVTCEHSSTVIGQRSRVYLRASCSALFLAVCFKETQIRLLLFNRAMRRALTTRHAHPDAMECSGPLLGWFEHAWRFAPTSTEVFYQLHRFRLDIALKHDLASPETLALAHTMRYNPPAKKKKTAANGSDEVIELNDEQSQSRDHDQQQLNKLIVENVVVAYRHCIDMYKFHTHINLALARLYHDLEYVRNDKLALDTVRPLFNTEKLKTTNKARKKQMLTQPFCRIYITPDMDPLHRPHKTIAIDRKAMRLLVTLAGREHDSSLLTIICTRTEHEKLLEDLRTSALQRAIEVLTQEVEEERIHPQEVIELEEGPADEEKKPVTTRKEKLLRRVWKLVQLELLNAQPTLKSLAENLFLKVYHLNQPVATGLPPTVQHALDYCKGKWLARKKPVRKKKSQAAPSTSGQAPSAIDVMQDVSVNLNE